MEKGAKLLLMSRQRRIIYIGAVIIALLIAINVFSYSAPSDQMMTSHPAIAFEFEPEHAANLEKQLKELNSLQMVHEKEIQNLRDTVHRLESQLNSQSRAPTTTTTEAVMRKGESDMSPAKSSDDTFEFDLDNVLNGIDQVPFPEITISNEFVSDTPGTPNAVVMRDVDQNAVIFEKGMIHGMPLLLERCATSLTDHHELDVLSAIAYAHNGFVPWFWSRESIGAALQNTPFTLNSEMLTAADFDNTSSSIFVMVDNSGSALLNSELLESGHSLSRTNGAPNVRFQTHCGWTIVQHPVPRFIAGMRVHWLSWYCL